MSDLGSLIRDSQENAFMYSQSSRRNRLGDTELESVLQESQASYQHEESMRSDYYLKNFLEHSKRDAISANDKLNEHQI